MSRGTVSRGARSYLVFGVPPCAAGACRASSRKTHSSRLCERGRQNKQVEGDGSKEENTHTKDQNPRGKGRSKPQPFIYWPRDRLGAKLPTPGATRRD